MFSYALKRVFRSLGLFSALLFGVVLASTLFTGINIGADTTAKAALNQQLNRVLVDVTARGRYGSSLASTDWMTAAEKVASVTNVDDAEIISRVDLHQDIVEKNFSSFRIVGIVHDSRVYGGLNLTSGVDSPQEDEVYVWIGSQDADGIRINDSLTFNYTFRTDVISFQLKVAGFVSLDETAYSLVLGQYQRDDRVIIPTPSMLDDVKLIYPYGNILIVSWEKTFAKILDRIHTMDPSYSPGFSPFWTEILVFLNREAVINPWDIVASQETINRVILQINNQVAEFDLSSSNNLQGALSTYQFFSVRMRISFLVVALPVFFVAWYVGSTVSDVSYNLRRREIGLLSVKGFSSGQLFRLFLSESLLVGIFGGLIGVGLSLLLSPYFITAVGGEFGGASLVLTPEVIVLAIAFSVGITLLSTFRPSRRAAKLPTIDALKEYMYIEETKPYKQKWPLTALLLGTYKIGMFLVGIPNLMQYFMGRPPPSTNILLVILLAVWIFVDSILSPIGPILFFWGFTKVFIRGSLGFQELVTRTARFLGDLGTLATKNVRRNPARAASVTFLIAMIIGYGFQTIGTLASEEDYVIRQVRANVGADISVFLIGLTNATAVEADIVNLTGIAATTLEYSLHGLTSSQSLSLIAVEPQEWLSTAYYEGEWFSGNDLETAFQEMAADNNTIILEQTIANHLELGINDPITLDIGFTTTKLRVVGFFGPVISGGPQPVFRPNEFYIGSSLRSYVPASLYHSLDGAMSSSGKILVKLEASASGERVAEQIRDLSLNDVSYVYSVVEQLEQRESDLMLSGTTNIKRIGVIFAVVTASVATALVALVSLQERKKEVALMNVRGLSLRQVITIILVENVSMVVFAIILGAVVGLITVHGNIAALSTTPVTLVTHRMVFPLNAVMTLLASLLLVFSSAVLPVMAITRRYVSKLERIVRA